MILQDGEIVDLKFLRKLLGVRKALLFSLRDDYCIPRLVSAVLRSSTRAAAVSEVPFIGYARSASPRGFNANLISFDVSPVDARGIELNSCSTIGR